MDGLKTFPQFIFCVVDKHGALLQTFTDLAHATYAANEPQYHGGRQMNAPYRVVKYRLDEIDQ